MNKTITLNTHTTGRYTDVSPFIICESLTLIFNGLTAENGNYYAILTCNGKSDKRRIVNNSVMVEKDFFSVGALYISVVYYLHGKKLGEWTIEPLCLMQAVQGDFSAEPTVAALEKELRVVKEYYSTLRESVTALKISYESFVENMKNYKSDINQLIIQKYNAISKKYKSEKISLLKYIYRHYCNDLRDSELDLPLSDFAGTIGLDISDLTDEEKTTVIEFTKKENVL